MRLTDTDRKVLAYLRAHPGASARDVAHHLWPDSPAWQRRTRKFGGKDPSALGGTMPMRVGRILWHMDARDLVYEHNYRWYANGRAT